MRIPSILKWVLLAALASAVFFYHTSYLTQGFVEQGALTPTHFGSEKPDPQYAPCPNTSFVPGWLASVTQLSKSWRVPQGPLPTKELLDATRGKIALEIGGPTEFLRQIGFYQHATQFDNVVRWDRWGRMGSHISIFTHDFRADGAALQAVAKDEFYDTVVSSHTLEHFPDPLRALSEWYRVLRPGGCFVLLIPYSPGTFDRYRKPHTFGHLLADYRNATRERYMIDVEESFDAWDVDLDAFLKGHTRKEKREYLRDRFYGNGGDNFMHWHVFHPALVRDLANCFGMSVKLEPVLWRLNNLMIVILRKGGG